MSSKSLGPQYNNANQSLDSTAEPIYHDNDIETHTFNDDSGSNTEISKRIFINLKVSTKVTCPVFQGTATNAEHAIAADCCDYVFDQYFDKKCEIPNYKILTIDETFNFIKTNRHLPTIKTNRSNFEKNSLEIGKMLSNLWETVEIQALYIKELHDRIKILEEKAKSQAL